jgi:CRP-like cAMP-binding protein
MARFPLLESLPEDDRRQAIMASRRRRFRRNEAIFREGDSGDSLHLIDKGHVAIRITTPQGEVATMRVLGPGDQFGEMATLSGEARMASAVCLDAVETLSLHRDVVTELRARHREIDQALLDAALAEVARLSKALTEVVHDAVTVRVPRQLLRQCEVFGSDTIPLTQDDLAGLCGTTRQTTNQVLQELQQAGAVVVSRGKVTVLDHSMLRSRAD